MVVTLRGGAINGRKRMWGVFCGADSILCPDQTTGYFWLLVR